eukprot:403354684
MGCNSSKQTIYLISDGKKVNVDKWASKDIQFQKSATITSQTVSQVDKRTSNNTPNSNDKISQQTSRLTSKQKLNERVSSPNRNQQIINYFNQASIRDKNKPFIGIVTDQIQDKSQQRKSSIRKGKTAENSPTRVENATDQMNRGKKQHSKRNGIDDISEQESAPKLQIIKNSDNYRVSIKHGGTNSSKFDQEFSKIQGSSRQNKKAIPDLEYSLQNPFKPLKSSANGNGNQYQNYSQLQQSTINFNSKKVSSQNQLTLFAPQQQASQNSGSRSDLQEYEYTFQAKNSPGRKNPNQRSTSKFQYLKNHNSPMPSRLDELKFKDMYENQKSNRNESNHQISGLNHNFQPKFKKKSLMQHDSSLNNANFQQSFSNPRPSDAKDWFYQQQKKLKFEQQMKYDNGKTPGRANIRKHLSNTQQKYRDQSTFDILKKNFDLSKEYDYISTNFVNTTLNSSFHKSERKQSKSKNNQALKNQMDQESKRHLIQQQQKEQQKQQQQSLIRKQTSFLEKSELDLSDNDDSIYDTFHTQGNNINEIPIIIQEQPVYPSIEDIGNQQRKSILQQRKRVSSARESRRISHVSSNLLLIDDSNLIAQQIEQQSQMQNSQSSQTNLQSEQNKTINKKTSRSLSLNQKSGDNDSRKSENFILPQINIFGEFGEKTEVDSLNISTSYQKQNNKSKMANHLRVSQHSMSSQNYYKQLNNIQHQNADVFGNLNVALRMSKNFQNQKKEQNVQMASMTVKELKHRMQDRAMSEKNSPQNANLLPSLQGSVNFSNKDMQQQNSMSFNQMFSKFKKVNHQKKHSSSNQFSIKITPNADSENSEKQSSNQVYTLKISDPQVSISQPNSFSFGGQDITHTSNQFNGTLQSFTYNIPTIIHSQVQIDDDDDNAYFYPNNEDQDEDDGYDTPKSKYSDGKKVDIVTNLLKPQNMALSYSAIKQSQERTNLLRQSYQDINQPQPAQEINLLASQSRLQPGNQITSMLRQSMQSLRQKDSEQFSPNFKIRIEDSNFDNPLQDSIQVSGFEQKEAKDHQDNQTLYQIPPHVAKKMNVLYNSKNMHFSDIRLNTPFLGDVDSQSKNHSGFVFDSIMLQSNDLANNYTQYSGSRKGSNMITGQSIQESKQAEINSYNNDDDQILNDENIMNLVSDSEVSRFEDEIYRPPKDQQIMIDQINQGGGKHRTHNSGNNIQGSSASVVYNQKGSSSDILQHPSQISGLPSVSRRTTSQNRQVQFKNSDKTYSKYSSQNMAKFLNRIMQNDGEDEDEDEDEFYDQGNRTSSITPNGQNMQFLSSAIDINALNKDSENLLSSNNQNKKRSLVDSKQVLGLMDQYNNNPKKKKKTSKIKMVNQRKSVNYVEYKFPDENN